MVILNDLHQGANRSAGTTAASAAELKAWIQETLAKLLLEIDEDLVILGDLFDSYRVENSDLLWVYKCLAHWKLKGHNLYMVPGNHDISNDSSKLSSFHLLCALLEEKPLEGFTRLNDEVCVISHVLNQDLFDKLLSEVPRCKYLLLHCNYDNNFAVGSDHSLNITRKQVEDLPVDVVYFAHEHSYREALGGKVFVAGNQYPTSISDCLDGQVKYYGAITEAGIVRRPSWDSDHYAEIKWDNLEPTNAPFVRLVGKCEPERAAEMATVVATYRRNSKAFIVGNAVEVKSSKVADELVATSFEAIANFDFMGTLAKYISKDELQLLESLK
jgi:metallophosphoesterase superfamily enzyme